MLWRALRLPLLEGTPRCKIQRASHNLSSPLENKMTLEIVRNLGSVFDAVFNKKNHSWLVSCGKVESDLGLVGIPVTLVQFTIDKWLRI